MSREAVFTDAFGQEVFLGDFVMMSQAKGWANNLFVVTRKGSTSLVQLNGDAYHKREYLVKVPDSMVTGFSEDKRKEALRLRETLISQEKVNPVPLPKRGPSPRYVILGYVIREAYARTVGIKYYLLKVPAKGGEQTQAVRNHLTTTVQPSLVDRAECSVIITEAEPKAFIEDDRRVLRLRFYHWPGTRAGLPFSTIKDLGFEQYINKEIPKEVIEPISRMMAV